MTIDNKQYLAPPRNTFKRNIAELRAWAAYNHWHYRLTKFIKNDSPKILECGCGPGFLSKSIKKWFPNADLYSCDYEYALIHSVKQELGYKNLFQANAQEIPIKDSVIDILISFHMIEHLEKPILFFENAHRVLKLGGYLIYAAPNPSGIPAKFMKDKWCGIRPDHLSLLSPSEWKNLSKKSGFQLIVEGTTGLSGIPIFKQLPLGIINFGLLFFFGFFPWNKGEAYIGIYQRPFDNNSLNLDAESVDLNLSTMICCPEDRQGLIAANNQMISYLNLLIDEHKLFNIAGKQISNKIDSAWIRSDRKLLYPGTAGIPILLSEEAILINEMIEKYIYS